MIKLSIIIPVYNERIWLPQILAKIRELNMEGVEKEIVIVDDGSTDGTREYLKKIKDQYVVIFHKYNQGKGMALRNGLLKATGKFIIVQDADLEYEPKDIPRMMQAIQKNNYQVLYGSRILEKQNKKYASFAAFVGSLIITALTNFLYGVKLTDVSTGYKLLSRDLLMSLDLRCKKFEFCTEVTAKIAKRKIHIPEIPIHYYPRTRKQGKKINWPDFFDGVFTLLRERIK